MANIDHATAAALNFPLTRVAARYQQLYDVPSPDVERHERELKRYLVLRSKLGSAALPTPKVLDRLWHVFLLYTHDYTAFCNTLGGFIHHVPTESSPAIEEMAERYREMLERYEEMFRELPPSDVWPTLRAGRHGMDDRDLALADFGECDSDIERLDMR
jgi:hypothetical protein